MPIPQVYFRELRDDWYRGADLMARLIDRSRRGELQLLGFPAQWMPLFEHFGADWADPIPPPGFVPIISDVSTAALGTLIESAKTHGRLRVLVEGVAALEPLVADVLHKLDRRVRFASPPLQASIPLTGWQSYGRPEVLDFSRRAIASAAAGTATAVLLPCARRRPYSLSKTHKRLGQSLASVVDEPFEQIVISSLGVVPFALWNDPVVLAYDSGVPDIYRVLRLMRVFFRQARYRWVVDCLEFEPYQDCLRIIHQEGLVGAIRAGPTRKVKKLPMP
jgi:hypothetical protein